MSEPEIALLMSTYQRPHHLRRALESIALQQGVDGRFELVITDDGSTDETPQIVAQFARTVPFRVGFTTHEHTTFRLSRCRNEGVRASSAPYLLFLDGDCVLPADHVRVHLERRKVGVVMAGDFCRLDQATSDRVTSDVIRSGEFTGWGPDSEQRRLRKRHRASRFYSFIGHPTKPKLIGNNVGIWRADYKRVNGYDENFEGWGCEDDDLRSRLRSAGVRIESILRWTHTYHLWHPIDTTAPSTWREGKNVAYLLRKGRLTRCRNGLEKRSVEDLSVRVIGESCIPLARRLQAYFPQAMATPEVEILVLPGPGRFSGRAECNVLLALDCEAAQSPAARQAHWTISPRNPASKTSLPIEWDQVTQALAQVA